MRTDKGILAVSMIMAGAVALATISLTDRMDRLDRKICTLQEQVESMDSHTCTDAQIKKEEATPTEPQRVTIEIFDYRKEEEATPGDASEPQEDTGEAEPASEPTETTEAKEEASGELEYAGIFELTAYSETGNTCANGNYPTVGHTAASNYFPLGTKIYIEGMGEYTIEDRGGMASNVIDIYMGDYDTCIEFGRKQAGIYIINEDYNE